MARQPRSFHPLLTGFSGQGLSGCSQPTDSPELLPRWQKALTPGPQADSLGREAGLVPQRAWEIKGSRTHAFWALAWVDKIPQTLKRSSPNALKP